MIRTLIRVGGAALVLLELVALWWRAFREPPWVRDIAADLDDEYFSMRPGAVSW